MINPSQFSVPSFMTALNSECVPTKSWMGTFFLLTKSYFKLMGCVLGVLNPIESTLFLCIMKEKCLHLWSEACLEAKACDISLILAKFISLQLWTSKNNHNFQQEGVLLELCFWRLCVAWTTMCPALHPQLIEVWTQCQSVFYLTNNSWSLLMEYVTPAKMYQKEIRNMQNNNHNGPVSSNVILWECFNVSLYFLKKWSKYPSRQLFCNSSSMLIISICVQKINSRVFVYFFTLFDCVIPGFSIGLLGPTLNLIKVLFELFAQTAAWFGSFASHNVIIHSFCWLQA